MDVSVVMLNWNDAATTIGAVATLRDWRRVRADIWVVDNGSVTTDLARLKKELPDVHLVCSDYNRGFAGGNNLAFQAILPHSDAPIMLLNSDARIAEDEVEKLLRWLQDQPEVGIIGPVLYETGAGQTQISAGGRNIARHINTRCVVQTVPPEGPPLRYVDYVPGTIAVLRAQVLREVGLFDEDYFFSGEVADWCERARRRGYAAAIAMEAVGYHNLDKPTDLRATLYLYYSLRNRLLFARKFEPWWRRCYWLPYLLKITAAQIYYARPAALRAIFLAARDGLLGRFGDQNRYFGK